MSTTFPSYNMTKFGFGIAYNDSKSYFYNFTNVSPAVYTPSYKGLGLPNAMYREYIQKVKEASPDYADCTEGVSGSCVLPSACEDNTAVLEYSF